MRELSDKQRRFCEEYVVDQNATQAAIRAGYSERTARAQAAKLLTKLNIDQYIAVLQGDLLARTEVSAEKVVQELAKTAFANFGDYFESWGYDELGKPVAKLKNRNQLTRSQLAAMAQMSIVYTKAGPKLTFKLHDKNKATELLMRHLGMFDDSLRLKTETPIVAVMPQMASSADEWQAMAAEAAGKKADGGS